MRTRTLIALSAGLLAVGVVVMLVGCGGTTHQTLEASGPTFVGRAACAVCHADINAAFGTQAHGQDFSTPSGNSSHIDFINGYGGACQPCHVTGYGEPSGWLPDNSRPYLVNIGCEECHGPGSEHVADPSKAALVTDTKDRGPNSGTQFMPKPIDQDTCWDCHVPTYKWLDTPHETSDLTLHDVVPADISGHYRQLPFLLGYLGYNDGTAPEGGPHALVDNTCPTCHLNRNATTVFPGEDEGASAMKDGTDPIHGATALVPDLATCATCHGSEGSAATRVEHFEEELDGLLKALGGTDPSDADEPDPAAGGGLLHAYAVAHGIDVNSNNNPDDPHVIAYKGAFFDYGYVLGDSSHGIHNPPFAEKLLEEAADLIGASWPPP
jgi:hypothetical protein